MSATVLVLDDELTVRESLKSVLETHGLAVIAASNMGEAGTALTQQAIDLILADLSLRGAGGREGLEFLASVRRQGLPPPLVIFTGHDGEDIRTEALALGAEDLWSKSLPIEEFVARVLATLRRHAPHQT